MKQFLCGSCRKQFTSLEGATHHARQKHRSSNTTIYQAATVVSLKPDDDDETMAELFVDAEISRSMGEPIPDWLADMMP